jgi:hypothetical protein
MVAQEPVVMYNNILEVKGLNLLHHQEDMEIMEEI